MVLQWRREYGRECSIQRLARDKKLFAIRRQSKSSHCRVKRNCQLAVRQLGVQRSNLGINEESTYWWREGCLLQERHTVYTHDPEYVNVWKRATRSAGALHNKSQYKVLPMQPHLPPAPALRTPKNPSTTAKIPIDPIPQRSEALN